MSEYLTAPSQRNQSTSSHCITPEAVLDDTIIPPEGKLEEQKYLPVSVQTFQFAEVQRNASDCCLRLRLAVTSPVKLSGLSKIAPLFRASGGAPTPEKPVQLAFLIWDFPLQMHLVITGALRLARVYEHMR